MCDSYAHLVDGVCIIYYRYPYAVEDEDIQFPMTVEAFPQYCMNMQKNSGHAFAEEFKVQKY